MGKFEKKKQEILDFIEEKTESGNSSIFVISSQSKVLKVWQIFITFLCIISSYIYINIAAFRVHKYEDEEVTELYLIFESFFLLDIIVQFFVERIPEGHIKPIRELEKLALIYLRGDFIEDFITILPI